MWVVRERGFYQGVSCGVVFYHEGRDIALAVHGDNFTFMALMNDGSIVAWGGDYSGGDFR